ncbi:hypothetical protein [Neobacillus sp. 19]|uniref:hypothetical protein n=1 Tax=Neobacillus sp. 19 TaxID=3394458 RepID=UPI003BF6C4CA
MKRKKQLNEFEKQNNQELIEMFNHMDTAGFKANVTVSDKDSVLIEGTAEKIELLIDSGIKFYFKGKNLLAYEKLGLDKLYYLKEATMECNTITTTESFGWTMHKELQIDLLESDISITIVPTE